MGNLQEALSWDNAIDQASDLGIGSDGNYFTIEDGENVVRILSEPVHFGVYFQGKGSPAMYEKNATEEVKLANKLTHRFACYVYNDKAKKIQIAEFGWSIVKAISEFSKSSQTSFKGCPPYDIIIKKAGAGMKTEYTVLPGRNEAPMSPSILEELDKKQPIKEYLEEKITKQALGDNPNATVEELESKKA